jgi:hypothetical protein
VLLNLLLADSSPVAWIRLAGLGSNDVVIGFLSLPLPVLLLGCAALWLFVAGPRANRPVACDRYGRAVYRRRHRFWVYPLAICLVVFAIRGMRDGWHGTITIDPDNHPVPVMVTHHSAPGLEERLDRLGEHLDRAFEHGATKFETHVDHRAEQIDGQLERSAVRIHQQLERVAAQIERQLDHVGRQIARQHHPKVPAAATPTVVVVAQTNDEPAVIEPNPPALPVSGLAQSDATVASSTPPASPAKPTPAIPAAPATPSKPAPTIPVAAAAAPASAATPKPAASTDVPSEKVPDWTKTEIVDEGNRKLVVVPGGFAGSQKEAEQDALEAARLVVGDAIQHQFPEVADWRPTAEAVREDSVRRTFVEQIHRKTVSSGTPFVVYRAYHQVELSPAVNAQLISGWKQEVLPQRLEALGGLAALLTLTFATGAAYFRLDDRTHGRYRGRLALAAVAIVGAGAAAAAAVVAG